MVRQRSARVWGPAISRGREAMTFAQPMRAGTEQGAVREAASRGSAARHYVSTGALPILAPAFGLRRRGGHTLRAVARRSGGRIGDARMPTCQRADPRAHTAIGRTARAATTSDILHPVFQACTGAFTGANTVDGNV